MSKLIHCGDCNHFMVCKIYDEHISKLKNVGVDITINLCKNYEEYSNEKLKR